MNLELLRKEREHWYEWKNIKPLRQMLQNLPNIDDVEFTYHDTITLKSNLDTVASKQIEEVALAMRPWRKGPFRVFETFIDSEWQSFMKYNLLEPHFNLKDKAVGDIGCNNGYYLFRMLSQKPKALIGFDPSPLYKTQFDFINFYAKTPIVYEMFGVEHLPFYERKFDILFCLGVLYHRSDPVQTLKQLHKGLNKNGELFLDTFFISGDEPLALCPSKAYSKIPNVYFVPTIKALENWGLRAGFESMEILEIKKTDTNEQRKTPWIFGESLGDFLMPNNADLTIEGYEAPKRVYVKLVK